MAAASTVELNWKRLMTDGGGASNPMNLLVALATAVGVVGFVTVVGGIITWIPFKYANLPADQSVAVKPRTELLAVGIARLIPALLVAVLVLLVLFAIEQRFHFTNSNPNNEKRASKEPAADTFLKRSVNKRDTAVAAFLVIAAALVPLSFIPVGEEYFVTALFGIVGSVVSYYVFWYTNSFAWFAVSILVATTLYASSLSLARTSQAPKLQGVALLTSDSSTGVRGILVAETADRVYLARISVDCTGSGRAQGDPESARILIVPREDVVAMNVGPPQLVCNAVKRSEQLLSELQALDLPSN